MCISHAIAEDNIPSWQVQAEDFMQSGQIEHAVSIYEEQLQNEDFVKKSSSSYWYNLGTLYAEAKKYTNATWSLEIARMLSPEDPEIIANLSYVRRKINVTSPAEAWSGIEKFRYLAKEWMPPIILHRLTVLTLILITICLCSLPWLSSRFKYLKILTSIMLALHLLILIFHLFFYYRIPAKAVVLKNNESAVRYSPISSGKVHFHIRGGELLMLGKSKNNWIWVERGPDFGGWTKKDNLLTLPELFTDWQIGQL